MQEGHRAGPAPAQDRQQRGRCDHRGVAAGSRKALDVAARRPSQQGPAQNKERRSLVKYEGAVRQVAVDGTTPVSGHALAVQAGVDLAGAAGAADPHEAQIVLVAALGAGPVPGREGGGLVEEEEAGVPARLEQRPAAASKLEPAGDPALSVELPANPPARVVQAASIAEDQPAPRFRDEVSERRDAVLQRTQGVSARLSAVDTPRRTLTEEVADSLVAYILQEGPRPGDLLPATAGLAERYGVSRTVVREAIADLAGRGILQRGQGRETIVLSPGESQLSGLLQFRVLQDGVSPEQVHELRRAIESITASLAAQRRTAAHLAMLEEALLRLESARSDREYHDADVRFHGLLAEASGNRLLKLVFEGIGGLVREERIRATAGRRLGGLSLEPVVAAHRAIFEAVKRRSPATAEKAMIAHLRQTEEGLEALRDAGPVSARRGSPGAAAPSRPRRASGASGRPPGGA